jgi:hypothetical protein
MINNIIIHFLLKEQKEFLPFFEIGMVMKLEGRSV